MTDLKNIYPVRIAGIGICVPDKVLTNSDLEKMVNTSDEWIKTRTGISERRISSYETATSDLASKAAENAIINAGIKPEKIDLVITATATPDMLFPATACIIQNHIGAVNAGAFDLEAGCSGFMYALIVASQFISTGAYNNVLVVGADELSKITNWEDRSTCVLFGDGAGAVILQRSDGNSGILSFVLGARGSGAEHLKFPAGGTRMPATEDTVKNKLHCIHMNGNEVFKFAVKKMGEAAEEAVAKAGITLESVDCFIPHQANIRIIDAAAKRLKLPKEKVFVNVDRYGNTSCASIPIALYEALEKGMIKKDSIIVMVGFGAGLTWASIVMKWS